MSRVKPWKRSTNQPWCQLSEKSFIFHSLLIGQSWSSVRWSCHVKQGAYGEGKGAAAGLRPCEWAGFLALMSWMWISRKAPRLHYIWQTVTSLSFFWKITPGLIAMIHRSYYAEYCVYGNRAHLRRPVTSAPNCYWNFQMTFFFFFFKRQTMNFTSRVLVKSLRSSLSSCQDYWEFLKLN